MSQIDHLSLKKQLAVLLLGHVEGWTSAGGSERRSQSEVRLLAEQVAIYPAVSLSYSLFAYLFSYNNTCYFLFVPMTEYTCCLLRPG